VKDKKGDYINLDDIIGDGSTVVFKDDSVYEVEVTEAVVYFFYFFFLLVLH
jgi:hypothetical protein